MSKLDVQDFWTRYAAQKALTGSVAVLGPHGFVEVTNQNQTYDKIAIGGRWRWVGPEGLYTGPRASAAGALLSPHPIQIEAGAGMPSPPMRPVYGKPGLPTGPAVVWNPDAEAGDFGGGGGGGGGDEDLLDIIPTDTGKLGAASYLLILAGAYFAYKIAISK